MRTVQEGTIETNHKGQCVVNDTHNPIPWSEPGTCCQCHRTIYGDGTPNNPFRHFETLTDHANMRRAHVLRMRALYPSNRYPYRIAGMDYLKEQTGIDVNA